MSPSAAEALLSLPTGKLTDLLAATRGSQKARDGLRSVLDLRDGGGVSMMLRAALDHGDRGGDPVEAWRVYHAAAVRRAMGGREPAVTVPERLAALLELDGGHPDDSEPGRAT